MNMKLEINSKTQLGEDRHQNPRPEMRMDRRRKLPTAMRVTKKYAAKSEGKRKTLDITS